MRFTLWLYYKPGSIKVFVRAGYGNGGFLWEVGIKHEVCGKLVVACNEECVSVTRVRGRQNGLEGIEYLEREAMLEVELNVGGIAALRVPQEGSSITSPFAGS